jgi:hypothetical protein
MTTLNVQAGFCFDRIEKAEVKHGDGGNFSREGSNKEEVYNNDHSFFDHSHNLMPCLHKVELNKFGGLDSTSWVDQMGHHFSLHAIEDYLLKL